MRILGYWLFFVLSGCSLFGEQQAQDMGDQIAIENCLKVLSKNQSFLIDDEGKILERYRTVRVVHYRNYIYSHLQFGFDNKPFDYKPTDAYLIDDSPSMLCWINRTDSHRVMQLSAPVAEDTLRTIDYVMFDPEVLKEELKRLSENSELLDDPVERIYSLRHDIWVLENRRY